MKRKQLLIIIGLLTGCASAPMMRFDDTQPLNPKLATVVGLVSEGIVDEPQGLTINITQLVDRNQKQIAFNLETLGYRDEDETSDTVGNSFVFQIPAGQYHINQWSYSKLKGSSRAALSNSYLFTVTAGEVAYIGSFHSNPLTHCLNNMDDFALAIKDIKFAHPKLLNVNIVDKSAPLVFKDWAHSSARDLGNGLCHLY